MLATKLRLTGDTQGRIWLSRLTRWQLAEEGEPPELAIANTEFLAAMEYRYDAGRQRYLVRPRKPDDLLPYNDGQGGWLLDNGTWHEYTGQSIYGDYAVDFDETTDEADVTETFAHAPGMAQYDHGQPAGSRRQQLFGNLVGTTERMVGESGMIAQRSVYTAFGELAYQAGVGQTRYGYCGAWGYEAATGVGSYVDPLAELGWLHVGERYYDPASGRFMQRDPIGIVGGINTYSYVGQRPTNGIDPDGFSSIEWFDDWPIGSHSEPNGRGGGVTFVPGTPTRRPVFRFDATGKPHRGIPTPHTHIYLGNVGPDGTIRPWGPCGPIPGPPPPAPPPSLGGRALKAMGRMLDAIGRIGMVFDAVIIECDCGAGGIGMFRGPGCTCGA